MANRDQFRFFDRLYPAKTPILKVCRSVGALGFSSLEVVLSRFGCNSGSKVGAVPPATLRKLESWVRSLRSGRTVRRVQLSSIFDKKRSGSFEGMRHSQLLPVRGQRTHSNAKTAARCSSPTRAK